MRNKGKGKGRFVFFCLAPAAILFIIFMIIPTFDVFRMSLYKWGGYTADKTFVGLNNFKILFKSDKFYQSFQNTILLIVVVTIVTFSMALIFAAILTREKIKGQNFSESFSISPIFVRSSYQCDFCNLRSQPGTFKLYLQPLPGAGRSGRSNFVAGKPETGYLQYCDCHGMAGHRILHGYVYGKYGKCAGKPL